MGEEISSTKSRNPLTYVVEHLDPELGSWSALEYGCIATESKNSGARFLLTSVPTSLKLPPELASNPGLEVENRGIEEVYADKKSKVCLLDPGATVELSPADGDEFEVFLFGGILGRCFELGYINTRSSSFYRFLCRLTICCNIGDDPPRGSYSSENFLFCTVFTGNRSFSMINVEYYNNILHRQTALLSCDGKAIRVED